MSAKIDIKLMTRWGDEHAKKRLLDSGYIYSTPKVMDHAIFCNPPWSNCVRCAYKNVGFKYALKVLKGRWFKK